MINEHVMNDLQKQIDRIRRDVENLGDVVKSLIKLVHRLDKSFMDSGTMRVGGGFFDD